MGSDPVHAADQGLPVGKLMALLGHADHGDLHPARVSDGRAGSSSCSRWTAGGRWLRVVRGGPELVCNFEPLARFERATYGLRNRCSTTEL